LNCLSATETCSRIATINYQEVLVDTNSTDKGEGLRYHLEKDPIAKEYLNIYQKNSSVKWPTAVLGTAGTAVLLLGFFNRSSADREIYLISGASIILVNFLIARTVEVNNETNLTRAVEEYNKRNLPKIYFNPENPRGNFTFDHVKVALLKDWSF
jgi:hypothetical protein